MFISGHTQKQFTMAFFAAGQENANRIDGGEKIIAQTRNFLMQIRKSHENTKTWSSQRGVWQLHGSPTTGSEETTGRCIIPQSLDEAKS